MDNIEKLYVLVSKREPIAIGVLVAIAAVLLTLIFLIYKSGSAQKKAVVLVGLCDAGKTLIFSRLIYNKFIQTQTSMKENTATYILKDKSNTVRLIDLPGNEKIRQQGMDRYKTGARAFIFVVDSLSFQKEVKDVAEYLYSLLTDSLLQKAKAKLLVACNKSDATLAKGPKVIKSQLEKEINILRVTQSAALESTSGTGSGQGFLGKRDKEFQFEDIRGIKVDFIECSAREVKDVNNTYLGELENWLLSVA